MANAVHLMVATPCYGGQVTVKYVSSALALQRVADQRGLELEFVHLSSQALITNARNTLVAMFLDKPEATHLLFIDTDQGFEPEQVFRLVAFGAEVSAAVSPRRVINWDKIERAGKEGRNPRAAGLDYVVNLKCDSAGRIAARNGFAQATAIGTGSRARRCSSCARHIPNCVAGSRRAKHRTELLRTVRHHDRPRNRSLTVRGSVLLQALVGPRR